MSLLRIDRTYHNVKRLRQVATVLIRYGLGDMVSSLKVDYYLAWIKRVVARRKPPLPVAALTRPMRVRLALQELGPTFIKLGQMLSSRPDVIPAEYASELAKLLDQVAPVAVAQVKKRIEAELGRPVSELFAMFGQEPIAAASVAQVHPAKLKSGEEVVVKVIRPGIEAVIDTDIAILGEIARLVARHLPEAEVFDPEGVVEEFSRSIRKELDLVKEGRVIERFAANFAEDEWLCIPKVYWDFCSQKVLTLQRFEGPKLSELDFGKLDIADRKLIAQRGATAILKQVLVHGLFHADPHPANIFILDGNKLGLVDYGIVGRIDVQTKKLITDLLVAIIRNDAPRAAETILQWSPPRIRIDRRAFVRDVMEMADIYVGRKLKEVPIASVFNDVVQLMTRYRIGFPRDLVLLSKALVTVEGIGRRLDPDFNMVEHATPFVQELLHKRFGPSAVAKGTLSALGSYARLFSALPEDILALLRAFKESQLEVGFVHKGLEGFTSRMEKVGYRLTLGLIISAMIIGSSLLAVIASRHEMFGLPLFSVIGFLGAIALAIVLLVSVLRS